MRRPRRDVDTDKTLGLFGSACCVFHLGLRLQLHHYVVVMMAPQQKQPASRTLSGPLVADLQPLGGEAGKEMSTLHRFTPTTGDVKIKKKKSCLINSALRRVCTLALPNGKTFSRPRRSSRRPPPLPHPHFLRLPPRVAEESCNYCTSVTVETTAQQSGLGHR